MLNDPNCTELCAEDCPSAGETDHAALAEIGYCTKRTEREYALGILLRTVL